MRRAREVLGFDKVGALMTATRLSLQHPREIVDEYVNNGFQSIFLRNLSPYGFALKTARSIGYAVDDFLPFYREALDYIIEVNRKGINFVELYAQLLLTRILTPFSTGYVDLQSPAGAGIGVAVYNYDGDVYASDESRMLAEMGDKQFKLGNVHTDSYEQIFGESFFAQSWLLLASSQYRGAQIVHSRCFVALTQYSIMLLRAIWWATDRRMSSTRRTFSSSNTF